MAMRIFIHYFTSSCTFCWQPFFFSFLFSSSPVFFFLCNISFLFSLPSISLTTSCVSNNLKFKFKCCRYRIFMSFSFAYFFCCCVFIIHIYAIKNKLISRTSNRVNVSHKMYWIRHWNIREQRLIYHSKICQNISLFSPVW